MDGWVDKVRAVNMGKWSMGMQSMVRIGLVCCACVLPMHAALAQAPGERQSGEVVSIENGMLTIKTAAGQPVTVALADSARVTLDRKSVV